MTKSLTYTWPVFVFFILYGFGILAEFDILPRSSLVTSISTLFFTIAGIYYLYTSPFGQTQFLPLATLVFIRYLIPILVPFNQITGISFYMGSNLALLFYYSLRTLQKESIQKLDYTKLFLLGGFILLQIAYYVGLLYIDNTPLGNLPNSKETYMQIISSINRVSIYVAFSLVLVHLWHVGKWEKDKLGQSEMELIDMIGEED